MRSAIVLNDGATTSALAGCKLVEIEGDALGRAVQEGRYRTLHEFTGDEERSTTLPAFSETDRERLRALLVEFAGLNERIAGLANTTFAEQAVHSRNAELLHGLAGHI
jgi:hypothetical protein